LTHIPKDAQQKKNSPILTCPPVSNLKAINFFMAREHFPLLDLGFSQLWSVNSPWQPSLGYNLFELTIRFGYKLNFYGGFSNLNSLHNLDPRLAVANLARFTLPNLPLA
jgi:hypothetical protein